MRKFLLGLTLGIVLLVSVFSSNTIVKAEQQEVIINSEMTIEEDTPVYNVDYVISDSCSSDMVFNIVSGTLTLDGCSISAPTANKFTTIFNVGANAKLVLKNTTFSDIDYSKCIVNNGIVEIDNVSFVAGKCSIENNGANNTDSIKYYSGNLESVTLNSGYISVYENTKVDSNVKVSVTNFANRTLIVKGVGNNVFASKYIDRFSYKDNTKIPQDNEYFLDYIGDFDTTANEIKNASGVSLRPGDIVLTTMSFMINDEMYYAPEYCTSYKYFKDEFEKKNEDPSYQMRLYRIGSAGRKLDNYTANMTESTFKKLSNSGNLITLNVKCIVRGDTDTVISSYQIDYLSGSNRAIFVDIPEGYEYEGVEFKKGSNSAEDILGILNGELYANNCYIRPIIEYKINNDYSAHTITANFIVKEKVSYANVELANVEGVELVAPNTMVVGGEYSFALTCAEDKIISAIKFNENYIEFDYDDVNGKYTFDAEVLETNTISVETKTILRITPNPQKVEFEYGETVELKEAYRVSETEVLVIEYEASEKVNRGTYPITNIKFCSSDEYVIEVIGNKTYSIVKKQVYISDIATKTHTVVYSENLVVVEADFLVNTLPAYLKAELEEVDEFVEGEQSIKLNFTILDANYIISGSDYVLVTLIVTPKTIGTDGIVFNGATVEYTGSKIELLATNYDADIIGVTYTYYLANDLTTPVEAVNVGEYIVKAVYSSKSSLYAVSGEKSVTLVITPKEIDMSAYLNSIEVTEFVYDGEDKFVDLKRESLPSGVVISSIDSEDTHKDANIYYYNVYFATTSNNYTCTSEKRISLIINARIVTIALVVNEFDYTGRAPNLVVDITSVVEGDTVAPIFENAVESSVGTHSIRVLRLNNTNYALANVVELEYEIKSVSVSLSGVSFANVEATYDGNSHRPELTGVLPLEISYTIDETQACVNAGVYNVKCTFTSSDAGIIAPSPIYATVTIYKRQLTAVFSEPSNMIANGQKKSLSVDLDGVVDGEEVRYSLEYSNEPILAGEYTCRISLVDAPNYTLKSNTPYRFIIFMSTINYSEAGVNLSVDGKFSSRENLTVSKINDKLEVVNLLAKMEIKNYTALNFSCVSFTSELMTVSIDADTIADKVNYLKAYRIKNNQLEEIEYTIKDNIISFKSNCNEKIIFVESYDYIYSHRVEINAIIIFAIVSMSLIIILEIINVRSKKKSNAPKQVK